MVGFLSQRVRACPFSVDFPSLRIDFFRPPFIKKSLKRRDSPFESAGRQTETEHLLSRKTIINCGCDCRFRPLVPDEIPLRPEVQNPFRQPQQMVRKRCHPQRMEISLGNSQALWQTFGSRQSWKGCPQRIAQKRREKSRKERRKKSREKSWKKRG